MGGGVNNDNMTFNGRELDASASGGGLAAFKNEKRPAVIRGKKTNRHERMRRVSANTETMGREGLKRLPDPSDGRGRSLRGH